MKRTAILIVVMVLSIGYADAQFWGVFKEKGNGDVTRTNRQIGDFSAISAANGLNVYIRQGEKSSVVVETDSNFQKKVVTEVEGSCLKLYVEDKVHNPTKFNVYVTFTELYSLKVSSGADMENKGIIHTEALDITVSSGAKADLELDIENLSCKTSSGASAKLKGKAMRFEAQASSGSNLKASKLEAEHCIAKASSGADIDVFVNKYLRASASSGGDIEYAGDPENVDKNTSSGGDISRD